VCSSDLATASLFGWLEDQDHRAVEIARLRKVTRRAQQDGRMAVMPAAMHQARLGRAVLEGVVLGHGQRVHVRAQADHPAAVAALAANHPDYARLAYAPLHFYAQRL